MHDFECFHWGRRNELAYMQHCTCLQVYLVISVQWQCQKKSQLSIEIESFMRIAECTIRLTLYYLRKGPNSLFFHVNKLLYQSVSLSFWLPRRCVDSYYLNHIAYWYITCKYQWNHFNINSALYISKIIEKYSITKDDYVYKFIVNNGENEFKIVYVNFFQ